MSGCICWYCFHGWPKQVMDIFTDAVAKLDGWDEGLTYGPAHIVWSDENFDDNSIQYCLKECEDSKWLDRRTTAQIKAAKESLVKLLAVPESIRCCEPEEYDGDDPQNFPPPAGMVMVHR